MKKSHCAAPWRGLHINLDGDIRLCCAGQPGSFGNIKSHDLTALTDSPYLREIRESIQQGRLHETYCESCIHAVGRGEREWFNETHTDIDFDTVGVDATHEIQSVDVRWNNTCNLACTYCEPYFSSTWARIRSESSPPPPARQFDTVVQQIVRQASGIRTAMLLGGEPLLIPHNQRLLEALPDTTDVIVITNLSVPLLENRVFQSLKPRHRVNWNISLENVNARFEFVRRGASWRVLCENLDVITQLFPRHTVGISAIYHVFNCTRLQEFKQVMHDRNININWNTVSQPCLDPRYHDVAVRQLALDEISALMAGTLHVSDSEQDFFAAIKQDLESGLASPDAKDQLRTHIGSDQDRFVELWPELQAVMT